MSYVPGAWTLEINFTIRTDVPTIRIIARS